MDINEYKSMTVAMKKAFWKKNPVQGTIPIELPHTPSISMYCDNDDTVVKELYWTKFIGWEMTSLKIWCSLLESIPNGSSVYDVGTYTGIYSLIAGAKRPDTRIVAFDIQDICLDRVATNVEINDFSNIEWIKAACTNFDGEVEFHYYQEEGILSSVASTVQKAMNNLSAQSKAVTLDSFTDEGTCVGLMKVDVEDAETSTMEGAKRLLAASQPDILMEVNNPDNIPALCSLFPNEYSFYIIDDANSRIAPISLTHDIYPGARNYLATARSKEDLLNRLEAVDVTIDHSQS